MPDQQTTPTSVSSAIDAPRDILIKSYQSPGDIVMMMYAIKAIATQHPGKFRIGVATSGDPMFEGCTWIDREITEETPGVQVVTGTYNTIHKSNEYPYHFVTGYVIDIAEQLGIKLTPPQWHGVIQIRDEEKAWFSAPREITGGDYPYWVIDAGHKSDFTAKAWDFRRYQAVVDSCPDILFVQIGLIHEDHNHPNLVGANLIDLRGKTDQRKLVRLVYNSFGVLTPVSYPMVLSFAVPAHPRFGRKSRGCVVVAGGREPNHWQQPPNAQFLHTCGQLDCCDMGGCWKSRVVPLGGSYADEKDNSLCSKPVKLETGQDVATCMQMITVDEVVGAIRKYQDNLAYEHKWGSTPPRQVRVPEAV